MTTQWIPWKGTLAVRLLELGAWVTRVSFQYMIIRIIHRATGLATQPIDWGEVVSGRNSRRPPVGCVWYAPRTSDQPSELEAANGHGNWGLVTQLLLVELWLWRQNR